MKSFGEPFLTGLEVFLRLFTLGDIDQSIAESPGSCFKGIDIEPALQIPAVIFKMHRFTGRDYLSKEFYGPGLHIGEKGQCKSG